MAKSDFVERLRDGDDAAWEEFWKRNAQLILQVASRRTRLSISASLEALEEIRSAAVHRFYVDICTFSIPDPDAYLLRIVTSECAKIHRGWENRHKSLGGLGELAASRGVSRAVLSREEGRIIEKGISYALEECLREVRSELRLPRASFRQAPLLHWAIFDAFVAGESRRSHFPNTLQGEDASQHSRLVAAAGVRLEQSFMEVDHVLPDLALGTPRGLMDSDFFASAWGNGDYGCAGRRLGRTAMHESHRADHVLLVDVHRGITECGCFIEGVKGREMASAERQVRKTFMLATYDSIKT
jgi:hypothetical protein